jgi:hypothetical protein
MREYLIGHTPEQNRGNPAPPVRGHDDDIASLVLCGRDDRLIGVVMLELHGLAIRARLTMPSSEVLAQRYGVYRIRPTLGGTVLRASRFRFDHLALPHSRRDKLVEQGLVSIAEQRSMVTKPSVTVRL